MNRNATRLLAHLTLMADDNSSETSFNRDDCFFIHPLFGGVSFNVVLNSSIYVVIIIFTAYF